MDDKLAPARGVFWGLVSGLALLFGCGFGLYALRFWSGY